MAGESLFASARASRSLQDAWSVAMQSWAAEAECSEINTDDTNEFFRAWLSFFMYGLCMIAAITTPYCLCTRRDKRLDKEAGIERSREQPNPLQKDEVVNSGSGRCDLHPLVKSKSRLSLNETQPNFEKAKEHFLLTSPLRANGKWRSVWFTDANDLAEVGGIGVELYFKLVRSLGLLFAYKTVFALPALVFASNGNFVPDSGNAARVTTLGNIGRMAVSGVPQEDRLVVIGCQGMELWKITPYLGWLDFLGVMSFIVFITWYRFRYIPKAVVENDLSDTTTRDFSVCVDCLCPRIDDGDYEEELRKHLHGIIEEARLKEGIHTEAGAKLICEVTLVRDFDGALGRIADEAKLRVSLEVAKSHKPDKPDDEFYHYKYGCCGRRSMPQFIQEMQGNIPDEKTLPVLRAFVILNSVDDQQRLLMWYRFANFALLRCCQSGRSRFRGTAIQVKEAPEPSAIIWRNQDVTTCERFFAKSVMLALYLLAMAISITLIYVVNRGGREIGTKTAEQVIGDPSCDSGIVTSGYVCEAQVAALWTINYARNLTGDPLTCYCSTQGYSEVLDNVELRDTLCKVWLEDAGKGVAITVGVSLIVVIANALMWQLSVVFVTNEKHKSYSGLQGSLMWKLFIALFFNMSLLVFFLNFNGLVFDGPYSDFNRGWYGVVGSTLCLNLCLNCFSSNAPGVFGAWGARCGRRPCCTRNLKHQAELIRAFENPPFEPAVRYAQLLATIFSTMVYSPGLPILNFFAALNMFLTYWTDKWILLQCSKRPPAYDAQMPKQAASLLLWAGPLHLFSAMFMFSNACTVPSKEFKALFSYMDSAEGSMSTNDFSNRISREATWFFFVALVVVVGLLVSWLLLWFLWDTTGVGACFRLCMTCCSSARVAPSGDDAEQQEEGQPVQKTFDEEVKRITFTTPPASYRIKANPDLKLLWKALESAPAATDGPAMLNMQS